MRAHVLLDCSSKMDSLNWKLELVGKVRASSWPRGSQLHLSISPFSSQVLSSTPPQLSEVFFTYIRYMYIDLAVV